MEHETPATTDPYPDESADRYDLHHRSSWRTRLTSRREVALLQKALKTAGSGFTGLDLPCGTGRFWPAFERAGADSLIAGDISEGMLRVARANSLGASMPARLETMSAFEIGLPDDAVDFTACMRFLHHLSMAEDRLQVLNELRRVSCGYVAISLWVDGNLGAWRRSLKKPVQAKRGFGRRICRSRREVEEEFRQAGFSIVGHYDVWPKLSMWRLYLLKCADDR